jgi:hypothetical protein
MTDTPSGTGSPTTWRDHLPLAALNVVAGMILLAVWVNAGVGEARFNDFYREAWPAYSALAQGHLLGFFRLAPAYVGSLLIRAPFALIPTTWGAGARTVYLMSAIPCTLVLAGFSTWCTVQLSERYGGSLGARVGPFMACVLSPIVIVAFLGGHPEDILGAVLCVAAVSCAAKQRGGAAAVLVGLAAINKSWAFIAIPVVLVSLWPNRRAMVVVTGAAAAAALALLIMASLKGGVSGGALGAEIGSIFNPPQLLWWFGPHSWIANQARLAIFAAGCACSLLWWLRVRRSGSAREALLLLALVMLLRAALDPWNNLYYHAPFVIALLAYEVGRRRVPVVTLSYSYVLLVVVPVGFLPMASDVRAALYAGVVVPTVGWFGMRALAPSGGGAFRRPGRFLARLQTVRTRYAGFGGERV